MVDQPVDHRRGQPGDLGQQAEAARADRALQLVAAGVAEDAGDDREVEELVARQLVQLVQGFEQPALAAAGRGGEVVADDQLALGVDAGHELVELQGEQPAVGAELDHVALDLVGDAADHLQALRHGGHVPDRDQVFDLQGRQGAGDLVEAVLVAFERGQGLVGLGQDGRRLLQDVADAVEVEGDDAHRLADGDDRQARLQGDALRGAVAGAGLVGGDGGVGHEVHGRADDLVVTAHHDGAVHLGQLAQPGGREVDVEQEAAAADLFDDLVVAEDDQPAGLSAQDSLQAVAQRCARRHSGQGFATAVVKTPVHLTPVSIGHLSLAVLM